MYDLIVIGGGPGGYVSAIRAAQLGLKTALVEKEELFGGTCLLRGCIPTKIFLNVAKIIKETKKGRQFGLLADYKLDLNLLQDFKKRVIFKLSKGIENLLKQKGVTLYRGTGFFEDPETLNVSGENLKSKYFLIATGSKISNLRGFEIDEKNIISSDGALEMREIPKSIAIIGAGAIGVEFASIYSTFGSEVHLFEIMPQILPQEDPFSSEELEKNLIREGIKIYKNTKVLGWEKGQDGLIINYEKDGEKKSLNIFQILSAVGRVPNTEGLQIERAGIKKDQKGFIPVNDFYQTENPYIYAIGDVIPTPMLAHLSSHEGIVAVEKIAGEEVEELEYHLVPSCTYSIPELASVGYKLKDLEEQGRNYRIGSFPFTANSKASAMAENKGKVFFFRDEKTDEILRVSIVGPNATELITEATVSIFSNLTAKDFSKIIHPHPTLSEALQEANLDSLGRVIHL
ncbi:MAG: dihydrolipoyl dehydrogenase [Thermoanaerobaculia bacterium]